MPTYLVSLFVRNKRTWQLEKHVYLVSAPDEFKAQASALTEAYLDDKQATYCFVDAEIRTLQPGKQAIEITQNNASPEETNRYDRWPVNYTNLGNLLRQGLEQNRTSQPSTDTVGINRTKATAPFIKGNPSPGTTTGYPNCGCANICTFCEGLKR
jgi:hypothetical protein